jgi:hypothetical protein
MDPKLSEQLQQMLAALLKNAQDAAAWASGQVPLLVQEKITLGRAEESLYMGAALLVTGLGAVALYKIWVFRNRCVAAGQELEGDITVGAFIGTAIFAIIGVLPPLSMMHSFLMVWFAPRLYIVEWLASQVK